jgi:putative spermidine/putrescine transport system permease protein
MLVIIPLAFTDSALLIFPPPSYSLRWLEAFLGDGRWLSSTWFSLWISAIAAGGALVMGTAAAFAIGRDRFLGRRAAMIVLITPLIVPHMVIALALFLAVAPYGLSSGPLGFLLAYAVFGVPYVLIIVSAGLQKLDGSLQQAAASLGAAPVVALRTITLPLLLPSLLSAFGFAFLAAFDDLVVALFFSSPQFTTLSMRIWDDIREEISPMVAVVSVLIFATILMLVSIKAAINRYF